MLLDIAIGDAYGAGFEFAEREKIDSFNNLTTYQEHGLGIPAGNYTDDTQMSLALAELILESAEWNQENIADKFVECFKRDIRIGYSKGFYNVLSTVNSGEELISKVKPVSTANGAAMRSVPLGVINELEALKNMAKIQASITHNTEAGIKSSQAIALASHFFIFKLGKPNELFQFVCEQTNYKWINNWEKEVACCGIETVNAVLTVLGKCKSLSDMLLSSVEFGGDVDTVAACALGIASLSDDYHHDLPEFLFKELENNQYGHDYLVDVSSKLMSYVKTNR
ncbi:ADP-ribosylglycohydrolase family protein [Motilimonas sp. 1_MG-2023]|uniref:ADP-ribosylglycohydrolase family protein n=1 Tax=Motilimonas sp. 1_MG-2023 TaxID=3062672 RepID=UPI0026E35F0D|nr:ADP-ribosylglycohydrolase family protein [Motilimonas sp. 1_MG-2023]MDO6526571.1 ADP-ribosylglycohydrolase family protein [Motilimonas sp. 1_MG-2023]